MKHPLKQIPDKELIKICQTSPDIFIIGKAYSVLGSKALLNDNTEQAIDALKNAIIYGYTVKARALQKLLDPTEFLTFMKKAADNYMLYEFSKDYIKQNTILHETGSLPSRYAFYFRQNKIGEQNANQEKKFSTHRKIIPYLEWGMNHNDYYAYYIYGQALYYSDIPDDSRKNPGMNSKNESIKYLEKALSLGGEKLGWRACNYLAKYYKDKDPQKYQHYDHIYREYSQAH